MANKPEPSDTPKDVAKKPELAVEKAPPRVAIFMPKGRDNSIPPAKHEDVVQGVQRERR